MGDPAVDAAVPFKEAAEMIREAGGEAFRACFQCGLCTASCPWNHVRTFMPHVMLTQSKFGLVELAEEDWWLCSTCNMCVSRCPRGVAITDVIRAVRNVILESLPRAVPPSLRSAAASLRTNGNPWGGPRDARAGWIQNLPVPTFTPGMELAYFSCCVPAFDPKMGNVARAAARVLNRLGVRFGVVGTKESCCGESVRKGGNYGLFERLATSNTNAFRESGAREIVVTSPHCLRTFKDDYPGLGPDVEIVHMTQYLSRSLDEKRLTLAKGYARKVVYHDPCYLGRHSGIYEEPRRVLSAVPGLTLMDEVNSRENSLCCGGGGGRIWMETRKGERFSDMLVEEAVEAGAQVLATACPYCILNLKDSVLTMGKEEVLEIKDVSEIVDEAM